MGKVKTSRSTAGAIPFIKANAKLKAADIPCQAQGRSNTGIRFMRHDYACLARYSHSSNRPYERYHASHSLGYGQQRGPDW